MKDSQQVIEAVQDAVIFAAKKFKKGETFDPSELQALINSMRIFHQVLEVNGCYPEYNVANKNRTFAEIATDSSKALTQSINRETQKANNDKTQ